MQNFPKVLFLSLGLLWLGGCKEKSETTSSASSVSPLTAPSNGAKSGPKPPQEKPLTIAYSDWPGWVAWDIAVEKGFFREAGVEVELVWLDYVPSMEAYSQGKVDAVCMTNGDALVSASSGAQSVGILLNDYSNGNDMVVAKKGIETAADLKGKKIGVEVGFVDHLLLLEALKSVGLTEGDVEIVDTKTPDTPALLKSGKVAAIAAWQPNSGQALEMLPGSKAIFTSQNKPGLIYDLLFVSPKSLSERRADWKKVTGVWFKVAEFVLDPATHAEAVSIMSKRVKLAPEKYGRLTEGTFILDAAGNQKHFQKGGTLESVYGSSETVNRFNVANHIYKDPESVDASLDPSLVNELVK